MLVEALAFVAVVNAVTFVLSGFDKLRASRGKRRVPERTLLGLALVGGSPGLLLSMVVFRHKTRKAGFLGPLVVILVLQGVVAWLVLR